MVNSEETVGRLKCIRSYLIDLYYILGWGRRVKDAYSIMEMEQILVTDTQSGAPVISQALLTARVTCQLSRFVSILFMRLTDCVFLV